MQIARKRKRTRAQKAWSEMTVQDQLKDATEAKARLQMQLDMARRSRYVGPDSWPMQKNLQDAITRWDATIAKLTEAIARGANK
jgi:hypothetical protein